MNTLTRQLTWLAFSGCLMVSVALAQGLEVIELKHRRADELIPVLQPLLESGAALTGKDYTLFVRSSGANLAQLRQAVAQLDRPARQLLVSVRHSGEGNTRDQNIGASGVVRNGQGSIEVRGRNSSTQDTSNSVASVSVLEGSAAFIATGQSVPIVTSVAAGDGRRPFAAVGTTYRDLTSGFLVTPRIAGDRVILEIEQQNERRSRDSQAIDTQRLTTQATAALGEWVQLGSVDSSASTQQKEILGRRYATSSDARGVWIKVEDLGK